MKVFISESVKDTIWLGERLGRALKRGDLVALVGELASGKTVLTKGIAAGLGVPKPGSVNSPTFIIVKEYRGRIPLYHFDMYRLEGGRALGTIDYDEYFSGNGVSVIEWADKIEEMLPPEHLRIELGVAGDERRRIRIKPHGRRYREIAGKIA